MNYIEQELAKYLDLLSQSATDSETRSKIDRAYNQIALIFSDSNGKLTTNAICNIAIQLRKLSESLSGNPLTQKIIVKLLFELLNHSLTNQYKEKAYNYSSSDNYSSNNYSSDNYSGNNYNSYETSYYDDNYNFNDNTKHYETRSSHKTNYQDYQDFDNADFDDYISRGKKYRNNHNQGFDFGYDICSQDSLLFKTDYKDIQTKQRLIQLVNVITVASIELIPFLIRTFIENKK